MILRNSALLQESRHRLHDYELASLRQYGLDQDPSAYCFTATYPPLKAMLNEKAEPPPTQELPAVLRLYVHIPFCSGRCSFCHFNVVTVPDAGKIQPYTETLLNEIKQIAPSPKLSRASSVYIGGGTPSLLPAKELARVVAALRDGFVIPAEIPFTLEVHPEIVLGHGKGYLQEVAGLGINRISVGVQDFETRVLQATGRRHTAQEAETVIAQALELGLKVNIDLLSPLPHQTPESWEATLERAFASQVNTVTLYTTSVRETMAMGKDIKSGIPFPTQEETYLFYTMAQLMSERRGYSEGSARWFHHQRDGQIPDRSFFAHEPILGMGCGAYGFINGTQYFNLPTPSAYSEAIRLGRPPTWKSMVLSPEELLHRELILSARDGVIRFQKFNLLFDRDVAEMFRAKWNLLETLQLATVDEACCRLTAKGRMLSDEVAAFFIGPDVSQRLLKSQFNGAGNRWSEHLNHFYERKQGEL